MNESNSIGAFEAEGAGEGCARAAEQNKLATIAQQKDRNLIAQSLPIAW